MLTLFYNLSWAPVIDAQAPTTSNDPNFPYKNMPQVLPDTKELLQGADRS